MGIIVYCSGHMELKIYKKLLQMMSLAKIIELEFTKMFNWWTD
jgi:hypothetical protein